MRWMMKGFFDVTDDSCDCVVCVSDLCRIAPCQKECEE